MAKLTDEDIVEIRRLRRQGATVPELLKQYPVGKTRMWEIVAGMTHRHATTGSGETDPAYERRYQLWDRRVPV